MLSQRVGHGLVTEQQQQHIIHGLHICVFFQREQNTILKIYVPLFVAELFTKAKIWKRSVCPLIYEWMCST